MIKGTSNGGTITGPGGFIKSGPGTLKINNEIGNTYEGETTISEGLVQLDMQLKLFVTNALGSSGIINLAGGTLQTIGQNDIYENYDFTLNIPEGKTGGFIPHRNCSIKCKVTGLGTLKYTITWLREYITGDWSEFTGVLNAYSSYNGGQLMLYNTVGLPNTRVYLTGYTKIINWATTGTMQLGGLSGIAGTYLGGSSKNTNTAKMTWIVGGASTDETFNGIINNDCSASGYAGTTTIVKEGTGVWRLNGANIYSGTTTITGGTLIVNGIQTGTAKVTVQNEAKLAGKSKMPAPVEIQTGATIEPGDSSISTFTVGTLTLQTGSTVNMEINKTLGTNDKIASTGAVIIYGTLNLSITGTLALGDQFTLFTGTTFTGTFENIVPTSPGTGLYWSFVNGVLSVTNISGVDTKKATDAFINIAPNPVSSTCLLSFTREYKNCIVNIETISGSIAFSATFNNCNSANLDLSTLPSGIYVLRMVANGENLPVRKIMKF
jgi:autotransporter-associated beta strand protein